MIGIVDIGSNTIRLSCYEILDDHQFNCVIHKKEMAGLASYIDDNGKMSSEGIDRAVKTIEYFKAVLQYMEMESIHFFATAAIRNTVNCQDIVSEIQNRTGYGIDVLTGEEEAICDFIGVSGDTNASDGMVIDIGGGSTEIVLFENKQIIKADSYAIGSLTMYKQFVKNIMPVKREISDIKKLIRKTLAEEKSYQIMNDAYGVGGSIRAILRLYNVEFKMDENNRDMESEKIKKLFKQYLENKSAIVDRMIKIAPERLHTIIPGMIILYMVVKHYHIKVVHVSQFGVREGYLSKIIK